MTFLEMFILTIQMSWPPHAFLAHLKSSALHLLDSNHLQGQQEIQRHDCFHHHLGEKFLLSGNQFGVQRSTSTLHQKFPLLSGRKS